MIGDDKMMLPGNMLHAEPSDKSITEIKERNDIAEDQQRKILGENTKRFFNRCV